MGESELELAQLLCTRLCHDLAGPIGAVAAGVELIAGDPTAADPETLSLIGTSSNAASLKLRFMRAVLGTDSGSVNGSTLDLSALLDGYLDATTTADAKPAVRWSAGPSFQAFAQAAGPKWRQAVLNVCLSALELQPGCRELGVTVATESRNVTLTVEAKANPARILAPRAELESALMGANGDALSAKTVQAFLAGQMIRAAGGTVRVAKGTGAVSIVARF